MTIPPAVLASYPPAVQRCRWVPVPPGGGLNGGRVWRGEMGGEGLFALKRWPVTHTPERMRLAHERMSRAAELDFVPELVNTLAGNSFVAHDRCWDVTTWKPGTSLLLTRPCPAGLRAAGVALGQLHRVWLPLDTQLAPCAAVARRLALVTDWEQTRLLFSLPELNAAHEVVRPRMALVRTELRPFAPHRGRVIPIHGDFWPENVLFQHERLTGVLDFGDAGFDHPEVDLGRLLADVGGLDRPWIAAAAAVYESANPGVPLSVPFVEVLARTGRVCSLAHWLMRVNAGEVTPTDALPRVRRLVALVTDGVAGTIASATPPDEDRP